MSPACLCDGQRSYELGQGRWYGRQAGLLQRI